MPHSTQGPLRCAAQIYWTVMISLVTKVLLSYFSYRDHYVTGTPHEDPGSDGPAPDQPQVRSDGCCAPKVPKAAPESEAQGAAEALPAPAQPDNAQ